MENFVITLTLLLIGILVKRLPAFPEQTGTVLNLTVITISLPALILLKIPDLSLSLDLAVPALLPWGMLALSAALLLLLSRLLNWSRPTTGSLLLLIPLGNTSFLGIPMVKAFFGDTAVPFALIYDQLGSFLALATYGSLIIALYGPGAGRPTAAGVLRKVLTFPPFLALILAFMLKPVSYPAMVNSLLTMLAATLVPLVMIAVGTQLHLNLDRQVLAPLSAGLAIKLILAPLAALYLLKIAAVNGEAARVSVFEAGMPPMVSAGALAILADLDRPLTAALLGLGILLSFVTLPLLYHLL